MNSAMISAVSATTSGGVPGAKRLGNVCATTSSGGSWSCSSRLRTRSATSSGGSEPLHPAYAEVSTSDAGRLGLICGERNGCAEGQSDQVRPAVTKQGDEPLEGPRMVFDREGVGRIV